MPTLLENIQNVFGQHLWGIELKDTEVERRKKVLKSPVPPSDNDGALISMAGAQAGAGALSSFLDYGKVINNEIELITKYRGMAEHPEVNIAIQNIINEMIVQEEKMPSVSIILDDLDIVDDMIKESIRKAFEKVLTLMKFKTSAYNLVRYWYIDGRLFINVIIDNDEPKKGIQELRYIDPRKIKYVKKQLRKRDERTMQLLHTEFEEYFIYNPNGLGSQHAAWKLAKDAVAFGHSGLLDRNGNTVLSHLHQALRILNQVRMLEDSMVIYRLARAPERRVFAVDVGHLPQSKAQQYVEDVMRRHKNKIVYDPATGQIDTSKRFMTMTDDFYIPMRDGKGTMVTPLPGAQNLGQIEDVQMFKSDLHRALNVPESRFQSGGSFNLGRSSEITRDEVNFQLFVGRLQTQFSQIFDHLMKIQLVLTGVCSLAEWDVWRDFITYKFHSNKHFAEMKDLEIMNNRFAALQAVHPFKDIYVDKEWIMKNVLRFDEDEIDEMLERIKMAKAESGFDPENPMANGMGMDPMGGPPGMGPPGMPGMPPEGMPQPPPGEQPPQDGVPWDVSGESDPEAPSNKLKKKPNFGKKGPIKESAAPLLVNTGRSADQVKLAEMISKAEEINKNDYKEEPLGISING